MTRICIVGGPRTGKTTLAESLSRRRMPGEIPGVPLGPTDIEQRCPEARVWHTDELIDLGWSEASAFVAEHWFAEPGPWITEGVAVCRALRKWRDAHPGEPPPVDRVIRLIVPHETLSKGQATMAKGEATVWGEIEEWLLDAGVPVSLHAELRCEHPGHNGMAVIE